MDYARAKKSLKKSDPLSGERLRQLDKWVIQKNKALNPVSPFSTPLVKRADFISRHLESTIDDIYTKQFEQTEAVPSKDLYANVRVAEARQVKGMVWKKRGTVLFKAKDFSNARVAYTTAIRSFLGKDDSYVLPTTTAYNGDIASLDKIGFVDVIACINNVSQCYIKEGDLVLALDWLEEVHSFYRSYAVGKLALAFGKHVHFQRSRPSADPASSLDRFLSRDGRLPIGMTWHDESRDSYSNRKSYAVTDEGLESSNFYLQPTRKHEWRIRSCVHWLQVRPGPHARPQASGKRRRCASG